MNEEDDYQSNGNGYACGSQIIEQGDATYPRGARFIAEPKYPTKHREKNEGANNHLEDRKERSFQ